MTTATMNRSIAEIRDAVTRQHGYLTKADLDDLALADRLQPVLVRCGGCRFTCAAQDARRMIGMVEAGGDYVRDVVWARK